MVAQPHDPSTYGTSKILEKTAIQIQVPLPVLGIVVSVIFFDVLTGNDAAYHCDNYWRTLDFSEFYRVFNVFFTSQFFNPCHSLVFKAQSMVQTLLRTYN